MASRAVLVLFLYRDMGLSPALFGVVLAAPGIGSLVGVAAVRSVTTHLGVGYTLLAATVLEADAWLLFLVAGGDMGVPILALAVGASAFWGVIWNVVAVSVRQVAVPPDVQARVAAIR